MSESYDFIHKLKPIRESEPGWWRLRWRPIRRGTYNVWLHRMHKVYGLGFYTYDAGAHNGWGRSWSGFECRVFFIVWELSFWLRWRINVHQDGPLDETPQRPLVIPYGVKAP